MTQTPKRTRPRRAVMLSSLAAGLLVVAATAHFAPWRDEAAAVTVLHGPGQRAIAAVTVFRGNSPDRAGEPMADRGPAETPVGGEAFPLCGRPPHLNCVIDGDTFYADGKAIRIADIDAPETRSPQCSREADLGAQATRRLVDLLNAGPFALGPLAAGTDPYGRQLRSVLRDGRSLGAVLVAEGLAEPWQGPSARWCG